MFWSQSSGFDHPLKKVGDKSVTCYITYEGLSYWLCFERVSVNWAKVEFNPSLSAASRDQIQEVFTAENNVASILSPSGTMVSPAQSSFDHL